MGRRCRAAKRSLRRKPHCTRYVRIGRLEKANLRAGTQRLRFSGRFRSHALRAGPYRATLTATDLAGNRSRAIRLTFRVVGR